MNDVSETTFGPAARGPQYLLGESPDTDRNFKNGPPKVHGGPLRLESHSRSRVRAEPIQHYIVKHCVATYCSFRITAIVSPCKELFIDPGCLTRGGITQSVTERLGPCALQARVC